MTSLVSSRRVTCVISDVLLFLMSAGCAPAFQCEAARKVPGRTKVRRAIVRRSFSPSRRHFLGLGKVHFSCYQAHRHPTPFTVSCGVTSRGMYDNLVGQPACRTVSCRVAFYGTYLPGDLSRYGISSRHEIAKQAWGNLTRERLQDDTRVGSIWSFLQHSIDPGPTR